MGKVGTVCIRCVLALHRMCVELRVFYPTISQRSCHVQHSTCSHNAAGHSFFNIQEFQAAFSLWYCNVSKCILHGKSAYSVHTVCSCIAHNVRWITVFLSIHIAVILPCTAILAEGRVLYMVGSLRNRRIKHPCFNSHSLQCKRILNALFYCRRFCFILCIT